MSHQSQHFPTFAKAVDVVTKPTRSASAQGLIRMERILLRGALYALLGMSVLNYLLGRVVLVLAGGPNFSYGGYRPTLNESSLTGMLYRLTSYAVPPEYSLLVATFCLAGLAASCRTPGPMAIVEEAVAGPPRMSPVPAPQPERHPLDPDPADPPIPSPPWKH